MANTFCLAMQFWNFGINWNKNWKWMRNLRLFFWNFRYNDTFITPFILQALQILASCLQLRKPWHKNKNLSTSDVWDYFNKGNIGRKILHLCSVQNWKEKCSVRSTKTTLRRHLVDYEYFLWQPKEGDQWRWDMFISHIQNEPQHHLFVQALCTGIFDWELPFNTVENQIFKKFFDTYENDLKIPCRTTVSRKLWKCRKREKLTFLVPSKNCLEGELDNRCMVIQCIQWLCDRYFALNWEKLVMQTILLDFVRFSTPHNVGATCYLKFSESVT